MTRFDVTPAELQSARRSLDKVGREVVDEVATLARAVDAFLDGGWTGDAAQSFGRGWNDWVDGAQDVLRALDTMAGLLGMAGVDFADSDALVNARFEQFTR